MSEVLFLSMSLAEANPERKQISSIVPDILGIDNFQIGQ